MGVFLFVVCPIAFFAGLVVAVYFLPLRLP